MQDKMTTSIPVKVTRRQLKEFASMKEETGLNRSILMRLALFLFAQQVKEKKLDPLELFREYTSKGGMA